MAVTKALIYNQAAAALLLTRRFVDPDTDPTTNEKVNFDNHYETALNMALADMDLESTANQVTLALLSDENHLEDYPEWQYVYSYPSDCAKFRRIKSHLQKDVRSTRIPYIIRRYIEAPSTDEKAIFTNEVDAIGEIVTDDFPLENLSHAAGLCVAYKLAWLSAPLLVGKGSQRLRADIENKFALAKAEAQRLDQEENFNYEEDNIQSEFVEARTD